MRVPALGAVLVVLTSTPAAAQPNRCVECHFANFAHVPATEDLVRWDRSPHARHGVACHRCHGGDPTTYQPVDAHRGVLNSRDPSSSVNHRNLALTCAACHAGVVAAFHASRHAAVEGAPDCATCHGAMGTRVPSAARLETTCRACHPGDGTRDYPALARARVEAVRGIEQTLARLETTIASITDNQKRNRLAAELRLARAALRDAADAIHTANFQLMDEQRRVAQHRTSELVAALMSSN